jgi:hypothetical protein
MSSERLANLEGFVESVLAREMDLSSERIRELIESMRTHPLSAASEQEAEQLARVLETRHGFSMQLGAHLAGTGYQPWLEAEFSSITFYYWSRYRRLLESKKFSKRVIASMNREVDRILGLLENPRREGPWARKGMVVGHVQSGKTANYTGLICKAADAGYRLIIVIAGVHNNLRNQTQRRIDEGFVGKDSARMLSQKNDTLIGVGRFDSTRTPATFTNSLRDFNKVTATAVGVSLQSLTEPVVLVVKKNSATLGRLLDWLQENNAFRGTKTIDAPMLLIDDEADNASINTAYKRDEITKINGQLRDLLNLFSRNCYVGYTATPFANIFIDPDTDDDMYGQDLFPRDFIVSLEPPTNYFSAVRVFHDEADLHVRHVEDHEDLLPLTHKIDHRVEVLPGSLMNALRAFVVASAIRDARGQDKQHSSMLVNPSRFTGIQKQIREALEQSLEVIRQSVQLNGGLAPNRALQDDEIRTLHDVWANEYRANSPDWSVIQRQLVESVSRVKVVEVNANSAGTLNYDDYEGQGLRVIAVGGYSLSRGLTLEGLTISYFLRNSRMYDTLMQMGRWFGYRPDYEDLCRIWMPEEAAGWYAHIASATEELREELRQMAEANATPIQFGLKVRAHPSVLEVTARNKMGTGELKPILIGLKNRFIETTVLLRDRLAVNRGHLQTMLEELAVAGHHLATAQREGAGYLLRNVPVEPVLGFVSRFQNDPASLATQSNPVTTYIRDRKTDELAAWDVYFPGIQTPKVLSAHAELGVELNCQRRTAGSRTNKASLYISEKQRVSGRGVERIGLDGELIAEIEAEYQKTHDRTSKGTWNYPDHIYRSKRPRPLLIVHLLAVEKRGSEGLEESQPVVAYSISFPNSNKEEKLVEYLVTQTWLKENQLIDTEHAELEDGDDE